MTRRKSSHLILQQAIDSTKNIKVPPPFPTPVINLDEFSLLHMGAKSNNLKLLKGKLP